MVSEKRWNAFYKAASDIFEQKGAIVIHHDLTVDDVNVYAVCADLRDLYRKGTLPQEYIDILNSKGMLWESVTVDWYDHYLLLRDFYNEYGRTDVRNDYVVNNMRLGVWTNKQRKKFAAQKLNASQIKLLNSLNFDWDNIVRCKSEVSRPESKTMDSWMHRFNLLQQHFDTYGNINIPKSYIAEDGTKLGLWLTNQRNRKDGLSDEQIKLLDSLNMTWYCFNTREQWDKTFDELLGFIKENGRAIAVPKDDYLHIWLTKQIGYIRNGTLTEERVKKLYQSRILSLYLDLKEWPFRTVSNNQTQDMSNSVNWNDMYESAKQFYEANGHLLMPKHYMSKNLPLEEWLHGQRQQYWCNLLDKDKIDKLNQIKMQWTVIEHKWAKCYISTRAFFNQYKTSRLPVDFVTDDNEYLGQWVSKQNAAMKAFNEKGECNLSPEQRALLQEIEIDGTFVSEKRTSFPEQAILFYMSQKFKTVYNGCKKFGFELDIYIDDVIIGIEYDGKAWHIKEENQKRDLKKNLCCKEANVTLIRVREPDLPSLENCINIHRKDLKLSSLKDVINDIIITINEIADKNVSLCDVNFTRDMGAILEQYRENGSHVWNTHFDMFAQYKRATGFSVLPMNYIDKTGFKLGKWLYTQVQRKDKSYCAQLPLSNQEISKLDSLNVPWNTKEYLWMSRYVEIALGINGKSKKYVVKHNNSDLQSWIIKQHTRWVNKKLNNDQACKIGMCAIKINNDGDFTITLSDTLTFEANIQEMQNHHVADFANHIKSTKKALSRSDIKWIDKYNSVIKYIDTEILTATLPAELYNWVINQRRLYDEDGLNEQRCSKINEFPGGFFSVNFIKHSNNGRIKKTKKNQLDVKWQKRIKTLQEYVNNPTKPNVDESTLRWYKDLKRSWKKGKLNSQRTEELNTIMGTNFCDVSLAQHVKNKYQQLNPDIGDVKTKKTINMQKWMTSLRDLTVYVNTPPDNQYADQRLLSWYNYQRNQYAKNKLVQKQIDLLNEVMNGNFYEILLSEYIKKKYVELNPHVDEAKCTTNEIRWMKHIEKLSEYVDNPSNRYVDEKTLAWYNRQKEYCRKNMLNEDRINELNNIMNGNFVEVSLAQYVKKKYALLYPQQKNVNKMKNSTNKQAIREREDETIVLQTSSITIFQHEIDLL